MRLPGRIPRTQNVLHKQKSHLLLLPPAPTVDAASVVPTSPWCCCVPPRPPCICGNLCAESLPHWPEHPNTSIQPCNFKSSGPRLKEASESGGGEGGEGCSEHWRAVLDLAFP